LERWCCSEFGGVVGLISGWSFAVTHFLFLVLHCKQRSFGIQIGLYTHLKRAIHRQDGSVKLLLFRHDLNRGHAFLLRHYLINLPVVGITGFIALISQYQIQFFWVGLTSSLAGILYITSRIIKFSKR
jgi:hypothetical protein